MSTEKGSLNVIIAKLEMKDATKTAGFLLETLIPTVFSGEEKVELTTLRANMYQFSCSINFKDCCINKITLCKTVEGTSIELWSKGNSLCIHGRKVSQKAG